MATNGDENEDYYLPLIDQRVFGAGIKRKRVPFVPASTPDAGVQDGNSNTTKAVGKSAGARYLDIVLPKSTTMPQPEVAPSTEPGMAADPICLVCNAPLSQITAHHESSLTHQLSLPHTPTPSHLPRSHVGVKYLTSYGWDPDSRTGLGVNAQGISVPVKTREKRDTAGLAETKAEGEVEVKSKKRNKGVKGAVKRLNAKEVRKQEAEGKNRVEKLRRKFYNGVDVEAYLGTDA